MLHDYLNQKFNLQNSNTSINQEVRAGVTTFLAMAYIIVVNPAILSQTGMDPNSIFLATCITSAIGCIAVGFLSNYPIGIAPGMAMNAFFSYQIVNNLNIPWSEAMGLIFITGILLVMICLTPIKKWIIEAIPHNLNMAISSGIGVFIGFIALKEIGLVHISSSGFLEMGHLLEYKIIMALLGFMAIITLDYYKVPGAIIISIITVTILDLLFADKSIANNITENLTNNIFNNNTPDKFNTIFGLDLYNIKINANSFAVILTFLFVVLFDSTGTLIAVLRKNKNQNNQKTANALLSNSIATIAGATLGTTPTSPYIESATGIKAGGKTGLTAVIIGLCFLLAIIFSPIVKLVPIYATAPALLYVACLMIEHLADIEWHKLTEAIPAALILMMIPFTFSIADGIGFGFLSYCILNLLCQPKNKVDKINIHPMMWVMSAVFIIYFLVKSS